MSNLLKYKLLSKTPRVTLTRQYFSGVGHITLRRHVITNNPCFYWLFIFMPT